MTRTLLATVLAIGVIAPATAQVIETPTGTTLVGPPGSRGVVSTQSDTTGSDPAVTYSPTGQPADTISADSAAAGNANQPSRVAPQGGAGGGGK
ncbi:hypothetical protein SAMN05216360_1066 [Methylobacterium phyllostachyos]|uniref:Uncharacterized protein n=1 Tax=Methylobacterium phyllostachyos TaxID=582672 RepID=A0A1G9YX90_9HYPH|nr:hypothetical protein [Methylobacterium phyllostachyos]SDN13772.1 hypothetical protein SAMN05216360_1066 [Methylobacterium phyllostachyos]